MDQPRPHTGRFEYHDDDCRCGQFDLFCNRDGHCWSCCGACKKDSECSGNQVHPTYWKHPKHRLTVSHYENHWPVYKTNAEIREAAPEAFED